MKTFMLHVITKVFKLDEYYLEYYDGIKHTHNHRRNRQTCTIQISIGIVIAGKEH